MKILSVVLLAATSGCIEPFPSESTITQALEDDLLVPDGHCARELSPGQHITILVDYCPDGYACPTTEPATWPLFDPIIEVLLCEQVGGLITPFATQSSSGLQGRTFNEGFDGD
jgi:hypothetical protein